VEETSLHMQVYHPPYAFGIRISIVTIEPRAWKDGACLRGCRARQALCQRKQLQIHGGRDPLQPLNEDLRPGGNALLHQWVAQQAGRVETQSGTASHSS